MAAKMCNFVQCSGACCGPGAGFPEPPPIVTVSCWTGRVVPSAPWSRPVPRRCGLRPWRAAPDLLAPLVDALPQGLVAANPAAAGPLARMSDISMIDPLQGYDVSSIRTARRLAAPLPTRADLPARPE